MPAEKTFLETIRGKRTRNIKLPNESGEVDPRLDAYDTGKHLRNALKSMPASLRALDEIGKKK